MGRLVFDYINKVFCLLFCCFAAVGCCRNDSRLERALVLAKDNRGELERVLAYYRMDSLKLQAAKFLIENMPGHLSYQGNEIDRYYDAVDAVLQEKHGIPVHELVEEMNGVGRRFAKKYDMVSDLEVITADYLIENIERAFEQWESSRWGAHLSFVDFCEWMLPYKVVELQPLDDWRAYLGKRFDEGLDNLKYCYMYEKSAVWATCCINSNLKDSIRPDVRGNEMLPVHRLSTKLQMPFGICQDYVEIAAAVLRSEGIPVAIDFTPQWPFREIGHSWNVVLANSGRPIPFGGAESNPGEPHKLDEKMAKVYRNTYAVNPDLERLHQNERFVPQIFRTLCIKDVTSEYMVTSDVEVEVDKETGGYIYLAMFDNKAWNPVAFAEVRHRKALFRNMGRDVLYLPVGYQHHTIVPLGNPFVLTSKGEVRQIVPQKETKGEMVLYRKYPLFPHVQNIAHRIVGGKFQAANTVNFGDSVTLHEITEWGIRGREVVLPPETKAYRYWRFYQPVRESYCNISEITFVDRTSHQAAMGKMIGTGGSYGNNPGTRKEVAFDGDLLTYFDAPIDSGGWVGMDFGHPVAVEKIIYTPRGDGNTIGIGDTYELFYWKDGRWVSLGRQVATTVLLRFKDVPADALYLLKNLSRGVEERIFLYKNGKQEFW